MRLKISESKNSKSFYVIRSTYKNGKHSSEVVEKLGTYAELSKIHADPYEWAKQYVAELNEKEKEQKREVIIMRKQSKLISKNKQTSFNNRSISVTKFYFFFIIMND